MGMLKDLGYCITISYEYIFEYCKLHPDQTYFHYSSPISEDGLAFKKELKYYRLMLDNLHLSTNVSSSLRQFLTFSYPDGMSYVRDAEKVQMGKSKSLEEWGTGRYVKLTLTEFNKQCRYLE